mgnify:CR=1 FL=1
MTGSRCTRVFSAALLMVGLATPVSAQITTGNIVGTVKGWSRMTASSAWPF